MVYAWVSVFMFRVYCFGVYGFTILNLRLGFTGFQGLGI